MIRKVEAMFDWMFDHFTVTTLCIVLFILTLTGVGDVYTVSMIVILLCAVGLMQKEILVDPWIIVPLIVCNVAGMASSYVVSGTIDEGYSFLQMIFPVVYLLIVCLDDEDLLRMKYFCVFWAGFVAASGIVWSVRGAVIRGGGRRLTGVLGGPNALGIFLVLSWFALLDLEKDQVRMPSCLRKYFSCIEPLLLIALAMTLSMGSFVSMAAGILWYLAEKKRKYSWKHTYLCACEILAKASLCFGTGLLIYLAASWTGVPASSVIVLLYAAAVVVCWPEFLRFLKACPGISAVMAASGALAAAACIVIRPSAVETFTERLEMMKNGLSYLGRNPLLGVGPYQWRLLNLLDSDKYFNTWHIHNSLLHIGVESGWIAMAMLVIIVVRVFKKKDRTSKAGFLAFCCHNMIDTSFFFLGITILAMMTTADPAGRKKRVRGSVLKTFFVLTAAVFAWNLYSQG